MTRNEPDENGERSVIIMTASIAAFEPDRAGRLQRSEGRHRRHDADHGARPRQPRHRVMTIAPSLFDTGLTHGIPQADGGRAHA